MLRSKTGRWIAGLLVSAAGMSACTSGGSSSGNDADPVRAAQALYAQRCASCHGPKGAGDGPLARSLPVPPRQFTNASWQARVSDEMIERAILHGGESVGMSALMPPNPDLSSDRPVLKGLVGLIRSFKSPPD